MSTSLFHRRYIRQLLPVVLALTGISATRPIHAVNRQKQVLVLYSARRDAQIAIISNRSLPQIIGAGLEQGLDYYSEYLDMPRVQSPEYEAGFRDFLLLKYKGHRFDLIIATSASVLEFLAHNRDELFPATPIVFFVNAPPASRPANSTGLIAEPSFNGTINLATMLQPDLRHVFIVSGTENDQEARDYQGLLRKQLASFEPRLTITHLSGLPVSELEAQMRRLPEHSAVLYLAMKRDGTGQRFHALQYLDRTVVLANAPTYSWVDSAIGRGIVGGALKNQQAETEEIGKLALRVLHGQSADRIPPQVVDLNVSQVDWRQLRRWGISQRRVPAGTLIKFREASVWDRYWNYVLGAVGLLAAQSTLIALLLVQARRRRRAEAQVRGGQVKLKASYERIRDLGRRLLLAQEAERTRIARELHDDVGQQLALLAIDLELISAAGPDLERETGTLIYETLNRARMVAKSVHDLSHRLHPEKLHLLGLVPALSAIQRECSIPGLQLSFEHQNVPPKLPHDVILCLFRIAQEALQNIVKHSAAHHVSIDLIGTDAELQLTIVDDGKGFDGETVRNEGLGLISMGERLDAIGGSLKIWTRPGAGTRLEVAVPLERPAMSPA